MRTYRVMKATLLIFCATLAVLMLFAVAGRVRSAYGAPEKAVVTRAYHVQAVRGQVARFKDAAVTIRAQRRELRKLRRQVQVRFVRDTHYSIRLASDLFGVPEREMWSVARCETGGTFSPFAKNRSSSASGLFQFLDSTWANQGLSRFSVFDPVAAALSAARIVAAQGWRQWSCKP